jgi:hypothetical protein
MIITAAVMLAAVAANAKGTVIFRIVGLSFKNERTPV